MNRIRYRFFIPVLLVCAFLINRSAHAQPVPVDFNSDNFQIVRGEVVEHQGKEAFKGSGFIPGLAFQNGIINVDMWVTGQRSYPSVNFRVQSPANYEHFYIRPHRAGLYPDAMQYTPCSNGIDSWQLFSGPGYTNEVDLPKKEWFHLRIEVFNETARVFINNRSLPDLEIYRLYHGVSQGTIGLLTPMNNTAYFANLVYEITDDVTLERMPPIEQPPGLITDWELSRPFNFMDINFEMTPADQGLSKELDWKKANADIHGFINVSNLYGRVSRGTDVVYARTRLFAEKDTLLGLQFGYSDAVMIFLNGKRVFSGVSGYTSRDPSFLGIVGLNDAVYLPLKKGENELLLAVAESFGGWGFICARSNAVQMNPGITKEWETEKAFVIPESIVWDPQQKRMYVTNFDQLNVGNPAVSQFISTLTLEGEIIEKKWVDGLNNPLGMILRDGKLYVCERRQVAIIDVSEARVVERIPVPESIFLNDIAMDDHGVLYISDSRRELIWKVEEGEAEVYLSGDEVKDPNVMYVSGHELLFGNSGDGWLKKVNLSTRAVSHFARFPKGFIDGIRPLGDGHFLVSLWKGKIYRVDPQGHCERVFHTVNLGEYCADFEYIQEHNLLLVPTFYGNKVCGYRLKL